MDADYQRGLARGRALAVESGDDAADRELQRLLLDPDSAVTEQVAIALLEQRTIPALRVLIRAWRVADDETRDQIDGPLSVIRGKSLPVGDSFVVDACADLRADSDPVVAEGADRWHSWWLHSSQPYPETDTTKECPHCTASMPIYAPVCTDCGIDFDHYGALLRKSRLSRLWRGHRRKTS